MCSGMPSLDWILLRSWSILPHTCRRRACWPLLNRRWEDHGQAHHSCSRGCACYTHEREDRMSVVMLLVRLVLALIFVVAGLAKLADLAGSRQALRDFGVPTRLANPFGLLLPLAELTVSVALLPTLTAWWGALGALALLLFFMVGISYNLARGRRPDCHCFGQLHSAPAGWPTLTRNVVLAAGAGSIVWLRPYYADPNMLGWFSALTLAQHIELLMGVIGVALLAGESWVLF